jgi:hypothetical protein
MPADAGRLLGRRFEVLVAHTCLRMLEYRCIGLGCPICWMEFTPFYAK